MYNKNSALVNPFPDLQLTAGSFYEFKWQDAAGNPINVTNKNYKITNTFTLTNVNCPCCSQPTVFERNDTFMWVPPSGYVGCSYDVTILSQDEMSGSISDTFRITVVNQNPVYNNADPN